MGAVVGWEPRGLNALVCLVPVCGLHVRICLPCCPQLYSLPLPPFPSAASHGAEPEAGSAGSSDACACALRGRAEGGPSQGSRGGGSAARLKIWDGGRSGCARGWSGGSACGGRCGSGSSGCDSQEPGEGAQHEPAVEVALAVTQVGDVRHMGLSAGSHGWAGSCLGAKLGSMQVHVLNDCS